MLETGDMGNVGVSDDCRRSFALVGSKAGDKRAQRCDCACSSKREPRMQEALFLPKAEEVVQLLISFIMSSLSPWLENPYDIKPNRQTAT